MSLADVALCDSVAERAPAKSRALGVSVVEGMVHAVLVGACESYLGALAVELGHGPTALAVLVTVPPLLGAMVQLLSGGLARVLGGRKRLVALGAAGQAMATLALGLIALDGVRSLGALLAAKIAFWVSGLVIAPAWGAWMASLTEGVNRERFFGLRQAVVQVPLLLSFLLAGHFLSEAADTRRTFAVLCAVGASFRLVSATLLLVQRDFDDEQDAGRARDVAPLRARLTQVVRGSGWRPALYLAALMMAANIAVPFFTPFALRDLGFDYRTFAWLLAVAIVAKAAVSPFYHRFAERRGLGAVLVASGIGISVVPLFWVVTDSVLLLGAAQVLSGITWGGLEFASYQILLRSSPERVRLEYLSVANSLVGGAQVMGGIVGSQLVEQLGLSYAALFGISGLVRALALVVLARSLPARLAPMFRLWMRVVSIRPSGGTIVRPIVVAALARARPHAGRERGQR